jgi:hypothetical protein
MVLVAVRWEVGPIGQRRSRGEMENSSRQPGDLTKLGQKAARKKNTSPLLRRITHSFSGYMMRGVPDDDDE